MVGTKHAGKNELEHEGFRLGLIHAGSNERKALIYWIGFPKGFWQVQKSRQPNTAL